MRILEIIQVILLGAACIWISITDTKFNLIRNKTVLLFGCAACVLDVLYYGIFNREAVGVFLLNVAAITGISLVIYRAHAWAAGDSKLMILVALLIPAGKMTGTLMDFYEVMIPVYAFAAGFLFLIADTVINIKKGSISVGKEEFIGRIKYAFLQFVINSVYVLTLLKIEDFVLRRFEFQLGSFQLIFNICILILIGHFSFFQRRPVIGFTAGTSLLYSIGTGIWMLSPVRLLYYGVTFVFVILQILIGEFNYREIPTSEVKPGMVLSMGASMMFANSRVKGLPDVSHEDMRSRLSEEEAEAIHRWEKSKYGRNTVMIVRKIPFAIFISVGTGCYFVIRGMRG